MSIKNIKKITVSCKKITLKCVLRKTSVLSRTQKILCFRKKKHDVTE